MKNKIHNLAELRAEIQRLDDLTKIQEAQIRTELKKSLSPMSIIMNGISAITGIPTGKHDLLKKGALVGLTFLTQQFIRKAEHNVEDKVSDLIEQMYTHLKNYISKINPFKKKSKEDSSNEASEEDEAA